MRRVFTILSFLFVSATLALAQGDCEDVLWKTTDTGIQGFLGTGDIQTDSLGNVYVATRYRKTMNLQGLNIKPNSGDLLVVKLSTNGDLIWYRSYPANVFYGAEFEVKNGFVYVAINHPFIDFLDGNGTVGLDNPGLESSILKFDLDGNLLWKNFYTGRNEFTDVKTDDLGNIYFSCNCQAIVVEGDTLGEVFSGRAGIFKLDPDGNYLWHNISNQGGQAGRPFDGDPLIIDPLGNPWMAGTVTSIGGGTNFTPEIRFGLNSVEITDSNPAWVAKFDPATGQNLSLIGVPGYNFFDVDLGGNIYLPTGSGTTGKLTKINSVGSVVWEFPYSPLVYQMYMDDEKNELVFGGMDQSDSLVFTDNTISDWGGGVLRYYYATVDPTTGSTTYFQELVNEAGRLESMVREDSHIFIRNNNSPWVQKQKINPGYKSEVYIPESDQTLIFPEDSIYVAIETEETLADKSLQWYQDGFAITGATKDSLLIVGNFQDGGNNYEVYVVDTFGCITKSAGIIIQQKSAPDDVLPADEVLSQIYGESNGDEWFNTTNWFADWSNAYGITYENIDGTDEVTEIDLSDNNLNITGWDYNLGNLPHLKKLDYSGNRLIHGILFNGGPNSIMNNLDSLDLSNSQIWWETFLIWNNVRPDIPFLNISSNFFTFGTLDPVFNDFENLSYYPMIDTVVHTYYKVKEGESVILRDDAEFTSGSETIIQWSKDGIPLTSTERNLSLSDLTSDDFGVYLQTLTNPNFPLLTYYNYHHINGFQTGTITITEGKIWEAVLMDGSWPANNFTEQVNDASNVTIHKIETDYYKVNNYSHVTNWDLYIDGDSIVVKNLERPARYARTAPELGAGKGWIENDTLYIPWFSRESRWRDTTRLAFYDDETFPNPPNKTKITDFGETLELRWEHDGSTSIYDVEMAVDGGPFNLLKSVTSSLLTELENLPEGSNLDFRVKSVNFIGDGIGDTVSLVTKQPQTVQITTVPDQDLDNQLISLSGSADSGLPVVYAVKSGKGLIVNGNQLQKKGAGMITVSALQPGNDQYDAAIAVSTTFEVRQGPQLVTFDPLPAPTYQDNGFPLSGSGGLSELPVTYTVTSGDAVTILGDSAVIVGTGEVVITASQAGNDDFLPAPGVPQTVCISPGTPSVTANGPTAFCVGDVTLEIESIPGVTYEWLMDGSPIAGATSNTYTTSDYGLYSVNLSASCSTTSSFNTLAVSLGDIPVPQLIASSGSTLICQGDSVKLFVVNEPGVSYGWRKDDVPIGGDTPQLFVKEKGNYSVTFENSCGTSVSTNSFEIDVLTQPEAPGLVVDGKLEICKFESTFLTAPFIEDVTYEWHQNDQVLEFELGNVLEVVDSGYYHLEIFNLCGRVGSLDTVRVELSSQAPIAQTVSVTGNIDTCFGGIATLSIPDQEGVNYAWYKNDTILVGLNSTEYEVIERGNYKVEISNDCRAIYSDNTVFVNIKFPPKLQTVTGDRNSLLCEGDTIKLSVPSEFETQYVWYRNSQFYDSAQNVIPIVESGEYYVEMINECGTVFSENAFEVNVLTPLPQPDIRAFTNLICEGDFLDIETDSVRFADYKWFLDGNQINANSSMILIEDAGTYQLQLENLCEESALSDPFELSFHTPPPIPSISLFVNEDCNNREYRLDAENGYITYQWLYEGITIAGARDPSYGPQLNGVYSLSVSDFNGCFVESEPITVEISEILKPEIEGIGDPDSLLRTKNLADQYQWFVDNIYIVDATERELEVKYNGNYKVSVIYPNGCIAFSDEYSVDEDNFQDFADFAVFLTDSTLVFPAVAATPDFEEIVVYPNPARESIKVSYDRSLDPDTKCKLLNINGELMYEVKMTRKGDKMVAEIDVSTYTPGLYIIYIENKFNPTFDNVIIDR